MLEPEAESEAELARAPGPQCPICASVLRRCSVWPGELFSVPELDLTEMLDMVTVWTCLACSRIRWGTPSRRPQESTAESKAAAQESKAKAQEAADAAPALFSPRDATSAGADSAATTCTSAKPTCAQVGFVWVLGKRLGYNASATQTLLDSVSSRQEISDLIGVLQAECQERGICPDAHRR